ncbi:transketolase [Levilactobacillus brevis]|nr:transketolase [Levilactobacillus brevis]
MLNEEVLNKQANFDEVDTQAVTAVRMLSMDMISRARSGHPGLPLGAAPMAYVLFSRHLRVDPSFPSGLIVIASFSRQVMDRQCYTVCCTLAALH